MEGKKNTLYAPCVTTYIGKNTRDLRSNININIWTEKMISCTASHKFCGRPSLPRFSGQSIM